MKKELVDFTKEEWNTLKSTGMLYELYPDAPDTYEHIGENKCEDCGQYESEGACFYCKMD